LVRPPVDPAAGVAAYQLGELHRLNGEFAKADEQYRRASGFGHRPEPGAALLRLAQGNAASAAAAIRQALNETQDPLARPRILEASVEILLAAGDHAAAEHAATELVTIAAEFKAPLLDAIAEGTRGAVLLALGDPGQAMPALRSAVRLWRDVDAPYEAARIRVFIGLASRDLGDRDTAALEFEAARTTFDELGAQPDLARLEALMGRDPGALGGLTAREVEVLRLLATGRTNRAIAESLVISEKTVARHVANIFTKLGLSSRSAATAYAYEHDLIVPTP
jgi:DNA-binding CsgD family transcriptional regulator